MPRPVEPRSRGEGMDHCNDCQFVYASVAMPALFDRLRSFGPRYRDVLLVSDCPTSRDAALRTRPEAGVWSALEYACHVRDVFLMQRERLYTALVEDKPSFVPMYRDERPTLARYNDQAPEDVVAQLTMAAHLLAQSFRMLAPAQLERLCIYNFPEPAERPLLWVGRHCVHEGEHHLHDVKEVLGRVRAIT